MLSVIQILGTIGVMSQVAWPVFAIFIPVIVVSVLYQVRTLKQELQILLTTCVLFTIMHMVTIAIHKLEEA